MKKQPVIAKNEHLVKLTKFGTGLIPFIKRSQKRLHSLYNYKTLNPCHL